jgi:hypothetical protein
MNQRIRELLGQAYDEAVPETWTTLSSEQLGRIYDKFAELIVRECMEQLNISNVPTSISAGLNLGKVAIKEHFGVEE